MDETPLQGPQAATSAPDVDPLVNVWFSRVKAGEKRWSKLHKRMRHNRDLVRGVDENADPLKADWNKQRANLIASTITVVLSKVYAKNPEMAATPTNKAKSLGLFAETVSAVTQAMLESAHLKKQAKRAVRAAMTCSFGVVKVGYQRVKQGDQPLMRSRIEDTQDNVKRLEALAAKLTDPEQQTQVEAQKAELEQALAGLQAQTEVVAAEGIVIDRVASDRWIIDPAVEDVWDCDSARWQAEKIPMPRSQVQAEFPGFDLKTATTYKPETDSPDPTMRRQVWSGSSTLMAGEDPILMVYEVWSKMDNRVYTLVEGCNKQFARAPYTPENLGERWWPYFVLPFQSVDGHFAAQSLVDVLEKLQQEHNETRDKFAELRRTIRPHYVASADINDKAIQKKVMADLGEVITIDTNGGSLKDAIQPGNNLQIDPNLFDTASIRADWEMVSGLQDAARSTVIQPKTATEAAISDQSLAARVAEFRDQIEDWLTEIAQYASELCLLNMTRPMVEQIMGSPEPPDEEALMQAAMTGQPPMPEPTYEWPEQATPDTVFNLVQIAIRAGSTAAPNKLQSQENWNKALQLLGPMIDKIRMLDMQGMDSSPERELLRETAARFDESIDVDRYLPAKPVAPTPVATLPTPDQVAAAGGPHGMPQMPPQQPQPEPQGIGRPHPPALH